MNAAFTLLEQIEDRVSLDRHGLISPRQSSYVMRTPRFRASRHVIWMIIPENGSEPALVAKVPRLSDDRGGIELEAAILRAAHADPRAAKDIIPEVVALEEIHGHLALLETAMPGRPISPAAIRRDRDTCLRLVTDWLGEFQHQRRSDPHAVDDWQTNLIDRPLDRILTAGVLNGAESRLIDKTRELIAELRDGEFPLVFEHGDLSHPNLLRTPQGRLAVLDWELADPQGLPASDLFFFLTYVAFATSRAQSLTEQVRAFDNTFFGKKPWGRPHVRRYVEQLPLPDKLLTPIFVLCWTRYLSGLIGRLTGDNQPARPLDDRLVGWLRNNRYFALWKQTVEHSDQLTWN